MNKIRKKAEELLPPDQFNWTEPPSEALLEMLQSEDNFEIPQTSYKGESKGVTPEEIRAMVQVELAARRAGQLIEKARATRKVSLRELGKRLGVSGPRVAQVQNGENLEIATLARFAEALGYELRLELVPKEGGKTIRI